MRSPNAPELAAPLTESLREPRRAKAAELFERAIGRGELPADTDVSLAMDLLAGPVYRRLAIMQVDVTAEYCDRLVRAIVAALGSA